MRFGSRKPSGTQSATTSAAQPRVAAAEETEVWPAEIPSK